jgi:hypothetical protein
MYGLEYNKGQRLSMEIDNTAGILPNTFVIPSTAAGTCKPPTGANEDGVIGVIQGRPAYGKDIVTDLIEDDKDVEVIRDGVVQVQADMALIFGDKIMTSATPGYATKAVHVTPEETYVIGRAWETTSTSGLTAILLELPGRVLTL